MEFLGRIVRLQLQRSSLKIGRGLQRRYDPTPLSEVASLHLHADGVSALVDAHTLLDVHHRQHADSKNVKGANGISLGFTSHYELMRERFGRHLRDGIAGENILVQTAQTVEAGRLKAGIVIETAEGTRLYLYNLLVAEPCLEFSRYALRQPPNDAEIREALTFLRAGMRGYYANIKGAAGQVRLGDRVYLD